MKVELIQHMGSDMSVVNAARVSFAKDASHYTDEQNCKLIEYLATGLSTKEYESFLGEYISDEVFQTIRSIKTHWTPFAHTALTFRVSAPIPIRTQCFKHKQGLVENEESRRYIKTMPEIYIPEFRVASENIKQGSLDIEHPNNELIKQKYIYQVNQALILYKEMLEQGVPAEQARFVLPQGAEVNWIWTGNLYAFANFYVSRTSPTAQGEIQELANMFEDLIEPLFPLSWKALTKGRD